jgi:hypothetical protein
MTKAKTKKKREDSLVKRIMSWKGLTVLTKNLLGKSIWGHQRGYHRNIAIENYTSPVNKGYFHNEECKRERKPAVN